MTRAARGTGKNPAMAVRVHRLARALAIAAACLSPMGCTQRAEVAATPSAQNSAERYPQADVMDQAETFFGRGAQGLADVMNRVFREHGDPDAYIKGEEGAAAAGVGVRYGRGTLYMRDGTQTEVFWRGPSLGIDLGGNASKVFVLIYELPSLSALFQRFGGVEGSLYYVGGLGVTYNRRDDTILAPVRFGLGWRQGITVGYLHLSPRRSWVPF
jgi:hypothetical protein